MSNLITSTTPLRNPKGHRQHVATVALFPDGRRMVIGTEDKTLRIWDLKTGVVLKKMEGHNSEVQALAVSRAGQIIASGDANGEVIVWHGETGESLTQPIKAYSYDTASLDFSADGTVLATGSVGMVEFWCTKTWKRQGNQIAVNPWIKKVLYSPSGELLAIAANNNIEIYNSGTRKRIATLNYTGWSSSLAWTPNDTCLLSCGSGIIQEWDTSTWEVVGDRYPWEDYNGDVIAINPAGTLVASASWGGHVRLWRLSDRRIVAIFHHSSNLTCVTFSVDGKHVLSGGTKDNQISEWDVPKGVHPKILVVTPARNSCITGELSTAEQLLTQEIDTDANNYTSYAHRSFIIARKQDWDQALEDAVKSISIQPSLIGYISEGIALCGQGQVWDARAAFDVASMFTNQDSEITHFLLLIKAIALFDADQHNEAMLLIKKLATTCPKSDTRACHVVDAYLHVQLGLKALDDEHYDEAADHFTAAVNSSAFVFSSKFIHEIYEDLIVLFGWNLESFWLTAHQKRCQAFLSAGKVEEALKSHQYMMDIVDETEKASCLDWSNDFKEKCSALAPRDDRMLDVEITERDQVKDKCSALAAQNDRILGAEIPGQDQDGYDAEPDFFRGMHGHSQISIPRPPQSTRRFKDLRLAMTRSTHPAPPLKPIPSTTPLPPSKPIPSTTPLRTFKGHEEHITAVAVFPDRQRMVTGSYDETLRLWDLKTGVVLKKMEGHSSGVRALVVSRDGQMIASGDDSGVFIAWHRETGESLTQPIKAHSKYFFSLDFSADDTVLATGSGDRSVKFWCTKTWQQQGNQITPDHSVNQVLYSPSGELLAIATDDSIEIYNSGTRECVTALESYNSSLAWMPDGTRLFSGSTNYYKIIQEWDTSTWKKVGDPWEGHTGYIKALAVNPAGTLLASASHDNHVRLWRLSDQRTIAIFQHSSDLTCVTFSVDGKHILSGGYDNQISEWKVPKGVHSKIFATITPARDSCITGDLSTAEQLITQEINTNANNYTSYANRSFIMARKQDWDHALEDATKSITIQPSLIGCICEGIALCGKDQVRDARVAFDIASMFTNQDSDITHFLLLIKAIALFNVDQHEEAMLLIKKLAAAFPGANTCVCWVVEAYLHVQLGTKALNDACHNEAVDRFTAAVNSRAFPSKIIHEIYEDLIVLFGWNLESLWLAAHQNRCQAFLSAGKVEEALESHQHMMDVIDETEKASCLDWSNDFKARCSVLAANDDCILGAEIPGQDQDGYDTGPDFFQGNHGHSQISRPQPQQRPGRFKKLWLATTMSPHAPPPLTPAPPATLPPATATFKAYIRHLLTWRSDHAAPPVVDVPFAQAKERNASADAPAKDNDWVPDEYFDDLPQNSNAQQPNTNTHQQQVAVQVDTGEHGGGKSCFCC